MAQTIENCNVKVSELESKIASMKKLITDSSELEYITKIDSQYALEAYKTWKRSQNFRFAISRTARIVSIISAIGSAVYALLEIFFL